MYDTLHTLHGGIVNPKHLFGRREITTSISDITKGNVVDVLSKAMPIHQQNAAEIDYLHRYARGCSPVLLRTKTVRPEICSQVNENHAAEISRFVAGYSFGEPITYVRRGQNKSESSEISILNDYMYFESKHSHDMELGAWLADCGVGYRMIMSDSSAGKTEDEAPFTIDTPDPRHTFVVYYSGFGHRPVIGVRRIYRELEKNKLTEVLCGYTERNYFEVIRGEVVTWVPNAYKGIPIVQYRLNTYQMGSFEPALSLLDTLNDIQSNRLDGLESYVQAFLKFKNCEVDEEAVKSLSRLGAIMIRSVDGLEGDVEMLSQELNQTQTQTLVDFIYERALSICGVPSTSYGNKSTNDSGVAVELRSGWAMAEHNARTTEILYRKSDKQFLRIALQIMREKRNMNLNLYDIDCKFTRRQHDNLLTKTQSLLHMLEAGLNPEVAIATCGLFNDPMDIAAQSEEYLKKWEYQDPSEEVSMEVSEWQNEPNGTPTETED